jgi:thiol-disulfide isomerase/thioredoxin
MPRIAAWALFAAALLSSCSAGGIAPGEPAPELRDVTAWVGTPPLTLESLRGKVVLVNFWTFGCINCRNTVPTVRGWHEKYAGRGLVIVGVHTPEFMSEESTAAVQDAVARLGIAWPVAVDADRANWNAWSNRYWPAFYFVDAQGVVRHARFGEGGYAESEAWIERLLAERGGQSAGTSAR